MQANKTITGTISGVITEFKTPINGKKGKKIRVLKIVEPDGTENFPQLHGNEHLLDGINLGDQITVFIRLYGKEIRSNQFHTPVIQHLEKNGNYIEQSVTG